MSIQFNKVTWYSKLAAVIVLVAVIWLALCFRAEFKKVDLIRQSIATVPSAVK